MLTLSDFSYSLPPELIAHSPLPQRDESRLLVFSRRTLTWSHHHFYELPQILRQTGEQYLIVRNNSQVIPARLFGIKPTGGHVEIFLVKGVASHQQTQTWECLTKPGIKTDQIIHFPDSKLTATCVKVLTDYSRLVQFHCSAHIFQQFLLKSGKTPIPPYIKSDLSETRLRQVYQTIYARWPGSVAAPTAGLHFTPQLTRKLQESGVDFADITLHVGPGTFLGVKCGNIQEHHMHTESYEVIPAVFAKIRSAVIMRKKILAVGTTTTRVLESIASQLETAASHSASLGLPRQRRGETNIFLYPSYQFQVTDSLITNFHLPESTLLMLVAAFTSQPHSSEKFHTWSQSSLGRAYADAIRQRYRFFSFGDAMLII